MVKALNKQQRQPRMESTIHQVVASILLRDLDNPVLEGVTITEVKMTDDLQSAKVYWTTQTAGEVETQKALKAATGRFRTAVAQKLGTRLAPTLTFEFDTLDRQVNSIEQLLARASMEDKALETARADAKPAGDVNPYKDKPERNNSKFD
ncbi:ribosome-binding factor A [Actinomycetota bacterium]|nr:ribosome-binding factor A [Actinomycetota bacterium]